jgi:hypothetical protein
VDIDVPADHDVLPTTGPVAVGLQHHLVLARLRKGLPCRVPKSVVNRLIHDSPLVIAVLCLTEAGARIGCGAPCQCGFQRSADERCVAPDLVQQPTAPDDVFAHRLMTAARGGGLTARG